MPGKRIRILIADDHPIFRSGLTRLIELDKELELIGEATDGSEALNMVQQKKPDILLMDLAMPRLTGIDVLQQLTELDVSTNKLVALPQTLWNITTLHRLNLSFNQLSDFFIY